MFPRAADDDTSPECAIVVIGRNEGQRLAECLRSLRDPGAPVVYVDSASSDGSARLAQKFGADVVEIKYGPFSAGRSRNVGFRYVREKMPHAQYVQFIDGDCTLHPEWLALAQRALESHPDVALACGRLTERHPGQSLYNQFCELEWRAPCGEIESSGGIFTIRADAFDNVGGFNGYLIAGEEPDLCHRLRRAGWKLLKLDAEMATHDAAIHRFTQWWRRCVRAGCAYAQGVNLHKREAGYWRRETRGVWFWGIVVPVVIVATAAVNPAIAVAMLSAYAILAARIYRSARRRDFTPRESRLYAALCILAKFPQAIGIIRFHILKLTRRKPHIIEYK